MRNYLNILILACLTIGSFFTQVVAQQAIIQATNVDINQGTQTLPIVYANSGVDIQAPVINRASTFVPAGDVLGLMASVNGDTPTLVATETLQRTLIQYGTFPTNMATQTPVVVVNNPSYVFNPARFSGGGGLVHDIIIWPTKLPGGGTTPVVTYDSITVKVLYIDAAAFRITNQTVYGLSGTLNLEQSYLQINAIAENTGLSANTNDLEFWIQLDNYSPRLLGSTSSPVTPGNQYGMIVQNFKIRNYYQHLPINNAFRGSTHILKIYAQEKTKVNTVGIAEFMVDASNSFPVELLAFDGYMDNHQVELNWASSNERNNSHFLVQKYLNDQGVYENIGRVEGVGFSDTTNYYTLTDPTPHIGVNSYRLIQVDMDGTAVVTGDNVEIVYQLETEALELVQAYPNPFKSNTTLQVRVPEAGALRLEIFDTMGKRVWMKTEEVSGGISELNLDLSDYRSGTFLYRINMNGETISGKLVKQ